LRRRQKDECVIIRTLLGWALKEKGGLGFGMPYLHGLYILT